MPRYYEQALEGYELQFTTADNLYYKNKRTRELDENLGDVHALIADKEIEIIHELSQKVLGCTQQFFAVAQVLAELDCLMSLSLVALKYNYVQPVMTNDDSLIISKGRHPLQERSVNIFIPNDTCVKGGQGFQGQREQPIKQRSKQSEQKQCSLSRICSSTRSSSSSVTRPLDGGIASLKSDLQMNSVQIVTGANFSGKSVYLKQIALIAYMAHIGSFVPAEKAIVGIVDKFYTRIQTSETVSKPQSAFGYDVQQLNRALHNATEHSLVIIDEFGKGTDSSDGAALFCTVIGYFLSKRNQCPRVIASTHFHDLISKDYLSAEDGITLSHTKIIVHNKYSTTNNAAVNIRSEIFCLHQTTQDMNGKEKESIGRSNFLSRSFVDVDSSNRRENMTTIPENPKTPSGNEVVFLYKIIPSERNQRQPPEEISRNNESHGMWCASIAGLPIHTIQRAVELSEKYKQGTSINRIRTQQDEDYYKAIEAIQNKFLETDINEINPSKLIASIEALLQG
ncbi:muts domain V-domain-containing protein [Mycotypha africana]|uniref:muts domain V-domain-containing protein n=1 Tax=Mycotypha africana TaxID=64632 RepID=UPI0022FFFD15|nr:muts domain V-domain-containing protein [Mycotypha africana]KAI8991629.1 muts domain V-domain-containing protein [Mycotypha africana]